MIPPTDSPNNTDTETYFPVWVIPDTVATLTTGIPYDCRTAIYGPYYSN